MDKTLCVTLIACALALTACSGKRLACQKNESLEQFTHVDAVEVIRDADKNFNDGDRHLLGVQSAGLYVPSFADNPDSYHFGIRVISGTSDTPCDDNEAILNRNAVKYATIYNKEMLKKVAGAPPIL